MIKLISCSIVLSIFFAAHAQQEYNHNIVAGADGIPHWQGFKSNGPTGKWGFQQNELMFIGVGGNVYNKGFSNNAMGIFNGAVTKEDIYLYNVNGANADFLVLKASGHVGIGTSSPSTHWSKVLQVYDFNNASLSVKTPVADWHILTAANGGLDFRDITGGGNAGRFFIASNGNLGSGTTSPISQLHLASDASHAFAITRGDGTYGFRIFRDANGGNILFQVGNNLNNWETKIKIGEGEGINTKLLFNPDGGNVLIGKTSQTNTSYKLDINGNVRANKVVVNTSGADFVFEDNYNLRSLAELQQYIRQNKHLPEIPSAKEMEKEGQDVGTLNIQLLQKIEELTLYIIQQQKEIEALKKKIE